MMKIVDRIPALSKLQMNDKEYYCIDSQNNRWGCKGTYGTNHICITKNDIGIMTQMDENKYTLQFVWDSKQKKYAIYCIETGNEIGVSKESLEKDLRILIYRDEISDMPVRIEGVALIKRNREMEVYGMGHMIFDVY